MILPIGDDLIEATERSAAGEIRRRGKMSNATAAPAERGRPLRPGGASSDPLSLQGLCIDLETPADTYHSGNSVYTCVLMSGFSIGC